MTLFDLLFPQPSPNRCKKVTKNKIKNNYGDDNFGFVQINTVIADFVNEEYRNVWDLVAVDNADDDRIHENRQLFNILKVIVAY